MSYLGYKVHTLSFLNVLVFGAVSPICQHDKNYAFLFLFILTIVKLNEISLEINMFVMFVLIAL